MRRLFLIIPPIFFVTHFFTVSILPFLQYDEIYYVNFALKYLEGNVVFDAHPPLGKLLIAVGIYFFNNNPIGWRIASSLAYSLVLLFGLLILNRVSKNFRTFLIGSILLCSETLLFVLGHFALLDIFSVLFVTIGYYFLVRYLNSQTSVVLVLAFISFGLASSVKWSNLTFLLPALLVLYWVKRLTKPKLILASILSFLISYSLPFLPSLVFGDNILAWHKNAWEYHTHLTQTHRYFSPWWSWWLDYHPTWFKFDKYQGLVSGVVAIGNPFVFLTILLSGFYSIWNFRKLDKPILIFLIGWVLFSLQWAFISRQTFIYNIAPAIPLGTILASHNLSKLWTNPFGQVLVWSVLALSILTFFFFFPLLIGWPISEEFYRRHIWFPSWV